MERKGKKPRLDLDTTAAELLQRAAQPRLSFGIPELDGRQVRGGTIVGSLVDAVALRSSHK